MLEVEVKLPVADREKLLRDLGALDFKETETVRETDTYYTSRFHDMIQRDEALRIRTIENLHTGKGYSVITYKGAKQDKVSMTRTEYETEIADVDTGKKILEGIGFYPVQQVGKVRTTCVCGDMTACVDRVDGLGDFLEIEIMAEEGGREAALARIENMLDKLGFSMAETTRNSYLSMLMGIDDEFEAVSSKRNMYQSLAISEQQIREGKVKDARESLAKVRENEKR
jgi:adenylate cyclase class 2